MGLEYTCVSSLYRSDFTRPKWEAEWTEKEIRDLCSVHAYRRSQHLHPGSIYTGQHSAAIAH